MRMLHFNIHILLHHRGKRGEISYYMIAHKKPYKSIQGKTKKTMKQSQFMILAYIVLEYSAHAFENKSSAI